MFIIIQQINMFEKLKPEKLLCLCLKDDQKFMSTSYKFTSFKGIFIVTRTCVDQKRNKLTS